MIACIYSGLPKLAANANAPFWHRPVAIDVQKTIINVKTRYPVEEIMRKYDVDTASRLNTIMLRINELMIRFGYEAFACRFVRINIDMRFVTVPTDVIADWKLF